jgi:hypothetical protein
MAAYGLQTLFEESVSQITATPSVALGTRRIEGGNEYIYAYNANTTAAVGYGVIASLNSGYSFSVTAALGNPLMGVVQNTEFTAAYYGWLLIRGLARSLPSTNACVAGTAICVSTNGAFESVLTALAGGTAVACGVSLGITSGSTGSAFIKAMI